MQSDPKWLAHSHPELYESVFDEQKRATIPSQRHDELFQETSQEYTRSYRDLLKSIIPIAMPNLEGIAWKDKYLLDDMFFSFVSRSPVRHLKLSVPIKTPWNLHSRVFPRAWPLRSLHLDIRLPLDMPSRRGTDVLSVISKDLLQSCASTLECLVWMGYGYTLSSSPVAFPRLRRFQSRWSDIDPNTLSAILAAPLRELELAYIQAHDWALLDKVINQNSSLPELRTFVIDGVSEQNIGIITTLLTENPHLRKLAVGEAPDTVLDENIVPVLSSGQFTNLVSLSLHWEGPGMNKETRPHIASIPEAALAAIGTISSLQQLCLVAGMNTGWRRQWLVDHDVLRKHLRGLQRLTKLAICSDTYDTGEFTLDSEAYYSDKFVWNTDRVRAAERRELDCEMDLFEDAKQRPGKLDPPDISGPERYAELPDGKYLRHSLPLWAFPTP